MLPWIVKIFLAHKGRRATIWFPLFFIWILLLPLALCVAVPLLVACLFCRVDSLDAAATVYNFLSGTRGTEFELAFGKDDQLSISIF